MHAGQVPGCQRDKTRHFSAREKEFGRAGQCLGEVGRCRDGRGGDADGCCHNSYPIFFQSFMLASRMTCGRHGWLVP